MNNRPVVLCILDGVGWGRRDDGDALYLARTPALDALFMHEPWCLLKAHGTSVGMPSDADMGNSEVGHNAMGAGRIFDQGAKLVDEAIATGRIWASEAWQTAIQGSTLHLLGLVSDGNVHSHISHLTALILRAVTDGVRRLRVHVLTDGRDVPARSALNYVGPVETLLAHLSQRADLDYRIATGGGRMNLTMDRYEADWSMVARGWDCHVLARGRRFDSATEAIGTLYAEDGTMDDQRLPAFVVGDYAGIDDGDAVVLFNFRGDRAIEICRAFEEAGIKEGGRFDAFERGRRPAVSYAGMMEYDGDNHIPRHFLVSPPIIEDTVGDRLAASGRIVLSMAETQKFGHVTYFFNGNRSASLVGEEWWEVPSQVVPFDQAPAMAAIEVTDLAVDAIGSGRYDLIRINLANGDMVGHTGVLAATIRALEVVDACVGRLVSAVKAAGGVLLVTADHGNADEMFETDKTGSYAIDASGRRKPRTSHSLNPVPFVLYDPSQRWELTLPARASASWSEPVSKADLPETSIAAIGATLLVLCGLEAPHSYLAPLVRRTSP